MRSSINKTGIIILILAASSCIFTIKPPKMTITGERSIVESNIIGQYGEIEKDAWAIASVKTNLQSAEGLVSTTVSDPQMFQAMKVMEFHSDDIRVLKTKGVLGENNLGFVQYLAENPTAVEEYEKNPDSRKILFLMIDEENKARRVLFERSLVLSGIASPSPVQIEAVGKKYALERADKAIEGDWLQNLSGKWYLKK